jgi:peroxiredoxin
MMAQMALRACQESISPTASRYARSVACVTVVVIVLMAIGAAQDSVLLKAPDEKIALSSLHGKVVVLVFSGVQDPQCRDEFKALDFLTSKYQGKPLVVYWVSISPPDMMNSENLTAACGSPGSVVVLSDPNQAAFRKFSAKIPQLPTVVILGKDGRINEQPRGGFSPDPAFIESLSARIDHLLDEK